MPSENNSTGDAGIQSGLQPVLDALTSILEPHYLLMILTPLTIIWLGAHGSLRRPASAAPAKLKKGEKRREEEKFAEGLVASDAIRYPLMLGAVLVGLYYLIQWLQDPAILNKVLRGYMTVMSVAGLGQLAGDALDLLVSLVFPTMWVGDSAKVYHIDPHRRCQYALDDESGNEMVIPSRDTPLPGCLDGWVTSEVVRSWLWEVRDLLTEEWTVRVVIYGKKLGEYEIRLNDLVRSVIAAAVALAYHFTGWTALSNLLSFAMCYFSFTLISPTSFGIGTAVLVSLFVYDVVMVFYTPYMITVAKAIDAPIKLTFETAKGASMLGLGDIIIPGMMMALALRFDLFMHYQRQIKLEPVQLLSKSVSASTDATTPENSKASTTATTGHRRIKPTFIDTRGQWGNRFWTTPFGRLSPVSGASEPAAATAFPKPYFYASLGGYAGAMVVTMVVMLVFRHGQPALLYLVPGVTGALWLTGLARGEIKDMWAYTEDGSLDTEDVVVEVDGEGKVVEGERERKETEGNSGPKDDGEDIEKERQQRTAAGLKELFVLSVTAQRVAESVS
ncbi:hypothetical protein VTJ49DRAFT_4264 [Mycothermus thermophilus]|uniref:Signal peptide peptidase n=1 Tax=Humicola insolens TaxID=85995 RepID=A0ABR3VLU8_HUMIN